MLSQLTKTIKLALKSTEHERAILRARSAVQRFPVVEWRQRMEDIHRRSINTSRSIAGVNAWRSSDGGEIRTQPLADIEDWSPEALVHPTQPEWDGRSALDVPSPSPDHWSQDTLRVKDAGVRQSYASDDYFSSRSRNASTTDLRDNSYHGFLEKANKVIASDHKHAPDPFLDGNPAPARPFGSHSRVSSVESISSIVDEKSNSPLNKAITSVSWRMLNLLFIQLNFPNQFTDADGGVAAEFVQKLQILDAKNSQHELSIEKFLVKSEEAFFGKARRDKLDIAASIRSSHRDSVWGTPSPSVFTRPDCAFVFNSRFNFPEIDIFK